MIYTNDLATVAAWPRAEVNSRYMRAAMEVLAYRRPDDPALRDVLPPAIRARIEQSPDRAREQAVAQVLERARHLAAAHSSKSRRCRNARAARARELRAALAALDALDARVVAETG